MQISRNFNLVNNTVGILLIFALAFLNPLTTSAKKDKSTLDTIDFRAINSIDIKNSRGGSELEQQLKTYSRADWENLARFKPLLVTLAAGPQQYDKNSLFELSVTLAGRTSCSDLYSLSRSNDMLFLINRKTIMQSGIARTRGLLSSKQFYDSNGYSDQMTRFSFKFREVLQNMREINSCH